MFLVLPSVCCMAGSQTTGISAGCIVLRLGDDDKDDEDEGGDKGGGGDNNDDNNDDGAAAGWG